MVCAAGFARDHGPGRYRLAEYHLLVGELRGNRHSLAARNFVSVAGIDPRRLRRPERSFAVPAIAWHQREPLLGSRPLNFRRDDVYTQPPSRGSPGKHSAISASLKSWRPPSKNEPIPIPQSSFKNQESPGATRRRPLGKGSDPFGNNRVTQESASIAKI